MTFLKELGISAAVGLAFGWILFGVTHGHSTELTAFEQGRADYSDGIAYGPRWIFCRVRINPTDHVDCSERPWRTPQ